MEDDQEDELDVDLDLDLDHEVQRLNLGDCLRFLDLPVVDVGSKWSTNALIPPRAAAMVWKPHSGRFI